MPYNMPMAGGNMMMTGAMPMAGGNFSNAPNGNAPVFIKPIMGGMQPMTNMENPIMANPAMGYPAMGAPY